jgi:hypothetical protein
MLAVSFAFLSSCSDSGGGAPALRTGTPPYYFQTAKDAYVKGDFAKANDWLDRITKLNKNEHSERAWAYRLLLGSGLLNGYKELADNYEYGQRSTKANPTPFIKKVTEYRGAASRMALQYGELYAEYAKSAPGAEAVIDFPFPATGSTAKPPQLNQIAQGIAPTEEAVAATQSAMLTRGVVTAICQTVGAGDDASKGRAALATPPVKVPRSAFELVMAKTLFAGAQLHNNKNQGNPAVQEFLSKQALKALESVTGTSKEIKELKTNIEKELKDAVKRKG